jgi:hypothetical protein
MRLWIAEDAGGRPVAPGFRETLQGINPKNAAPCAPIDVFEPA